MIAGHAQLAGWAHADAGNGLAAARLGERRVAETALAAAERTAVRPAVEPEPDWLYWLDAAELAAMTGRCLAALGRPLRAVRLLSACRTGAGPRTAALDAAWLARAQVGLGEVEQACRTAVTARAMAAAAGSVRAYEVEVASFALPALSQP